MGVVNLDITSRTPLAGGRSFGDVGPYEQLDGTVRYAVSPGHPRNGGITDLALAPEDQGGMVGFSGEFSILRPTDPARGNGRLLLDVLNRGKRLALRSFNRAPDPYRLHCSPGPGQWVPHGPGLHPGVVRVAARRAPCPRAAEPSGA